MKCIGSERPSMNNPKVQTIEMILISTVKKKTELSKQTMIKRKNIKLYKYLSLLGINPANGRLPG